MELKLQELMLQLQSKHCLKLFVTCRKWFSQQFRWRNICTSNKIVLTWNVVKCKVSSYATVNGWSWLQVRIVKANFKYFELDETITFTYNYDFYNVSWSCLNLSIWQTTQRTTSSTYKLAWNFSCIPVKYTNHSYKKNYFKNVS